MTDTKIQLRGNCPCCGRQQAVVGTRMSKHGYTVDHGWFNGVCPGHHYAPMQIDRTVADEVIADTYTEVAQLLRDAAALKAGKAHPKQVAKYPHTTIKGVRQMVDWADASEYERSEGVRNAIYRAEARARQGEAFASQHDALLNQVHGTPLIEVAVETPRVIEAGSRVKIQGKEVVVTAVEYRECRGIGPSMNGQWVEHVLWVDDKGATRAYPKRYARLI